MFCFGFTVGVASFFVGFVGVEVRREIGLFVGALVILVFVGICVGINTVASIVPVMVLPVDDASVFVVFPMAATCVELTKLMDDCFSARIFIDHVPTTPAPFHGLVGFTPRVTEIFPFACDSGVSMTGSIVPGVKLSICIAVGS